MPRPAPPDPQKLPLAYLITFHTYGTRLHGAPGWTVDREHNQFGTPMLDHNAGLEAFERELMTETELVLDPGQRSRLETTIREVLTHRGWELLALSVRTTHIHVVVVAPVHPDRVMNDLKAWCTRKLKAESAMGGRTKFWARHGSTRWLYDVPGLEGAIDYVLNRQH